MRLQNEKVCGAFLKRETAHSPVRDYADGYYMRRGSSISTDGRTLWSYSTPIAMWSGGRVIMSGLRYSNTTSRQQADLRTMCGRLGVEYEEKAGAL